MIYKYDGRTIFILGAPRSGTSWLAKMFDSHPEVVYRHEPDILVRNETIPTVCEAEQVPAHVGDAARWLTDLAQTRRLKCAGTWPVLRKSFYTERQFIKRSALIAALKMAERTPFLRSVANAVDIPDYFDVDSDIYRKLVIKSVSGLGRARLIAAASPESHIIVILRHPCGQVESMLRGIRRSLFEDNVEIAGWADTPSARRRNLTVDGLARLSLPAQLAWIWVFQNELAIEALAGATRVQFVRHSDLAEHPEATARTLFELAGLDWRREVTDFIKRSTQATGRERYYEIRRDPLEAATKWRKRLSPSEIDEISTIASQSAPGRMFLEASAAPVAIAVAGEND